MGMSLTIDTNYSQWSQSPYQLGTANARSQENAASLQPNQPPDRKRAEDITTRKPSSAPKTTPTECSTCKNRKYQDGSDDPGVSFKSAAHIDPGNSSAVVMSHEQEHVRNETVKATGEKKEVISQTVSLETSVCPECGRVYTSGGKTRTVTRSKNMEKDPVAQYYNKANPVTSPRNISIIA
jgi:hypothetical protein